MATDQLRAALLVPTGYWSDVFGSDPGLPASGFEQAFDDDVRSAIGYDTQTTYRPDSDIGGLGADTPYYVVEFLTWSSHAADFATLAIAGHALLKYLTGLRARVSNAVQDDVAALKMAPFLGSPLLIAVAAASSAAGQPTSGITLGGWSVSPLFMLFGEWPHAQQQYLVVGRGEQHAYYCLASNHGDILDSHWASL